MIPVKSPVLILGARSGMAQSLASLLAAKGHPLMLAARKAETLEADVSDLKIRHQVEVTAHDFDVLDIKGHAAFWEALPQTPRIVICAIGLLGEQDDTAKDPALAERVIETNFTAPCLFLEMAGQKMDAAGNIGMIVGIGSVAGDRGRAKNYIYGSAKAGFAAYLSGMRQKYVDSQLRILTVKPGFVRTAMTEGMDLPGPLTSEPDDFAAQIVKAMERGKSVHYDLRWRLVMTIIKLLPEKIFMRTKF